MLWPARILVVSPAINQVGGEVRDTDEWAGKVQAVVKRLGAFRDAMGERLGNKPKDVDTKVDEIDKKLGKILNCCRQLIHERDINLDIGLLVVSSDSEKHQI